MSSARSLATPKPRYWPLPRTCCVADWWKAPRATSRHGGKTATWSSPRRRWTTPTWRSTTWWWSVRTARAQQAKEGGPVVGDAAAPGLLPGVRRHRQRHPQPSRVGHHVRDRTSADPSVHRRVRRLCGGDIRCADYAATGTPDVGANAVKALEGRGAALIANHGLVAVGPRPDKVMHITALVERTAQIVWGARASAARSDPGRGQHQLRRRLRLSSRQPDVTLLVLSPLPFRAVTVTVRHVATGSPVVNRQHRQASARHTAGPRRLRRRGRPRIRFRQGGVRRGCAGRPTPDRRCATADTMR